MNARLFRGKTARKLLSCILSASILCSLLPVGAFAAQVSNTAEAAPTQNVVYEDIENHWGKEQILTWSEYGVFAGYNGKFRPDDPITRGELAVVINAVMDYQTKSSDVTFKDLDEAFYTDPILRLAEAGVMCGAYGLVRPKDNVTREETAVMLCKAFGLTPETVKTKFVDQDAISDWAVGSVSAMKNRGYIAGTPAGEFRPGASVTRAEVAAMLSGCVAAYITEQGSYSVEETGIVIVKSSSVTISNSALSDNIIASGKVTADGSVLLKNTTVAGEMIAISGNEKVFQVENTTTGGSGGGGGGSTPIAPIDLKAVEEDQHVLDIQGGTITVADGTSIYELTKGIENLDGYDYNVTNSADEAKSGDLETGDVLTVTTEPGKTYTIEVLPRTAVTGIQLSETTLSMKEGDVKQLEAVVSPADATDSRILWATSNARVANMENGVVTATGAGTATLTATTMDGSFVASCEVTVTEALVHVESLEISKESITLAPGEAGQLGVIVHPEFADNTAVTWSSSNPNVAAAQDGGFVKAAAAGTAVITAVSEDGGKKVSCQVTVTDSTTPANVEVVEESVTDSTVLLQWDKQSSKYIPELESYSVYCGNKLMGTTQRIGKDQVEETYPTMGYKVEGLEPNTTYTFTVVANQKDGQTSQPSKAVTVTTKPAPTAVLDVSKAPYNAVADGATVNTAAIQQAIDDCPKGGVVYVPEGTFVTGALFLHSDMTLKVDGMLLGSLDVADYPVVASTFEGWEMNCFASLINIGYRDTYGDYNAKNVVICGEGEINGNGFDPETGKETLGPAERTAGKADNALKGQEGYQALGYSAFNDKFKDSRVRGKALITLSAQDIYVTGVTISSGPAWTNHLVYSDSITYDGVKIIAKYGEQSSATKNKISNGDGIDPESSSNINIFNCYFYTGDDCVAIKAGKNLEGYNRNKPSENIRVTSCYDDGSDGAFVVGSEMSGGVRNVLFQDNEIYNALWDTLYIKLTEDRGGLVTNLTLKDTDMQGCQRAIRIERYNGNGDGLAAPVSAYTENILIENLYGFTSADTASPDVPISISGFDDTHFSNLHLKDLDIDGSFRWYSVESDGVTYDTVTTAYVNNVDNSTFDNVVINGNEEPQWIVLNSQDITGIDSKLILPLGTNYQGENASYYQLDTGASGTVLKGKTDDKNPLEVLNNALGCAVLEVTGSGVTYTMPKVPAGTYKVMFHYYQNGTEYGTVSASLDHGLVSATVDQSGSDERLGAVNMGYVEFTEDGAHTFTVTLTSGSKFTVDQINLIPVDSTAGITSPSTYTERAMKNIQIWVKSEMAQQVKTVGFSIQSNTGNDLLGSGKFYDANSGLFVLDEENMVLNTDQNGSVYTLEIPQSVYMTMEAGEYKVHAVGYSDDAGQVPVEGADWRQTIQLDVPALKTENLEIYPSNALAMTSQEFTSLKVNGVPVFVEQEYNNEAYKNDTGLDTRERPKTHIARLAASYDQDITVEIETAKPIHDALVRPTRLVEDVKIDGNRLTFTIHSRDVHPELARNIVVTVENTDTVNEDASLNPLNNYEVYADFNLLIDDMEENKPALGGNVINLLDIVPDIDRTGQTIVTDEMNQALASVAGQKGVTATGDRKTLYIPYGVYQCGTLNLPTNAKVYLDNGAYIVGTGNYQDYPQTEQLPELVIADYKEILNSLGLETAYYAQQGNDNGEYMSYSRQLFIDEADDTTLFGRGTVDCNGWQLANSHRGSTKHGDVWTMKDGSTLRAWVDTGNNEPGWYTAETLRIQDSTNVEVQDVLLRNSPAWTVHPLRCDQLNITGVKVVNDVACNSDDGFDVDSSSNVTLDRIFFNGNDDAFVMKTTGTANGRMYEADGTLSKDIPYTADHQLYAAPTCHVWAQNSLLLTRMNTANRIGTEENAVVVYDIHYVNNDCLDNLVCISITPKDDAEIHHIYFENNVYDRPKVLFEIEALVRSNGEKSKEDEFDPGSKYLNYNGFTNPGQIDYKDVLPWYDRYDQNSPRFDTMGYFHDIVINNNTIQNYTYMGYDGGFGGSTYQIVGPELFNRKQNNADLSNVPTHGQIMDNVTITNTLFRDAAIYEMNGNGKDYNDENRMIIYSDRLIAKVENMYWGSREFTEMMPIADPVSPRINNLEVYSDQAPSAMLVSPESNLSCAPHKIENRYMGPYITIRTLYSVQDLKNIEVYAVPAKGGELAEVKVAVMTNGKYLTAQGEWTKEETFLTAKLAENGNYVLTLKDSVLETLENGMYTLIVYAVGADGTESGRETVNYELAVDDSKPLPPTNVEQPTSARTFTTVDITWDAPYDYQSGDTYKVYYGVLNSGGSYDMWDVSYNMPYSGNGTNGYYQSKYTVCAQNLSKLACIAGVEGNSITLTGLSPCQTYVVYVSTVRDGVESPVSKWALANTKVAYSAGSVNITDFGASVDSTDNTKAIQAAIDACPANGTVVVPAGTYVTGALFLDKDHVTLQLEDGAVLKAFTAFEEQTPACISQYYPYICSASEGVESDSIYAGLLNVIKVESDTVVDGIRKVTNVCDAAKIGEGIGDVSVIGSGVIDVDGLSEALGESFSAINVINGAYVYMKDFKVINASGEAIRALYSKDSTIPTVSVAGVTTLAAQANGRNIIGIDNEAKTITVIPNTSAEELFAQLAGTDGTEQSYASEKSGMEILADGDIVTVTSQSGLQTKTYTVTVDSARLAESTATAGAVKDIVLEYTIDKTVAERADLFGTVQIDLPDGITATEEDTINVSGRGDITLSQKALEADTSYLFSGKDFDLATVEITNDGSTVIYRDADFRAFNGVDVALTLKGKTVPQENAVFQVTFAPDGGEAEVSTVTMQVTQAPTNLKRVLTEDSYSDFTSVELTWEGGQNVELYASKNNGAWEKLDYVTVEANDIRVEGLTPNSLYCFKLVSEEGISNVLRYYSMALDVTEMGAVGDGKTNDAPAINRAIACLAQTGGGQLVFPGDATYLSTSIHLQSNVYLHFEENAILQATSGIDLPEDMNAPFTSGQDYGHSHFRNALLWGERIENVKITASNGGINGAGMLLTGDPAYGSGLGDKGFAFKLCKNIELSGESQDKPLILKNGGHFAVIATGTDNITVNNIYVPDAETGTQQRDVFNFMQCNDVTAMNTRVEYCSNDVVKVGSDYALGYRRDVENMYVENISCKYIGGGNVFQLGSETIGDFKHFEIKNISVTDNTDKAGFGICVNDGSRVEDVVVDGIDFSNTSGGIFLIASDRSNRVPEALRRPGTIDGVTVKNATLTKNCGRSGYYPVIVSGFQAYETVAGMTAGEICPIRNITFENVNIEAAASGLMQGGQQQSLEDSLTEIQNVGSGGCYRPSSYPGKLHLPAYGLLITKVENMTVKGGSLTFEKTDDNNRFAMVIDNSKNITVDGMTMMQGTKIGSIIQVRGNSSYELKNVQAVLFDTEDAIGYTVNEELRTVDASGSENWLNYTGENNVVELHLSQLHPNITALEGTTVTVTEGTTWKQMVDQLLSVKGQLTFTMADATDETVLENGDTWTAAAAGGETVTFTVVIPGTVESIALSLLEDAAPAEGEQAEDAAPVEGEQSEDAAPAEGEQSEDAASAEGEQSEDAAPTEGEQSEDAAPAEGEQAEESAPVDEEQMAEI